MLCFSRELWGWGGVGGLGVAPPWRPRSELRSLLICDTVFGHLHLFRESLRCMQRAREAAEGGEVMIEVRSQMQRQEDF